MRGDLIKYSVYKKFSTPLEVFIFLFFYNIESSSIKFGFFGNSCCGDKGSSDFFQAVYVNLI